MNLIAILLGIIVAYLIGSFSLSHLIAKKKGVNLKELGSKNYGASNTLIVIGKKEALLVLLSDVAKGFLACILCNILTFYTFGLYWRGAILIFGAAAILGHIFPFYLKFNGGKGFATFIGVVLAVQLLLGNGIGILIVAILLAIITDYIIVGTLVLTGLYTLYWMIYFPITTIPLLITTIIIWYKHFENIGVTLVCTGIVKCPIILSPDNLIHPFVLRCLKANLIFAFGVADIEKTSDGHCELFAVRRDCYAARGLLLETAGNFDIVVRYRNLGLCHLATLQIEVVNLILKDKHHCGAVVADSRILERVVK